MFALYASKSIAFYEEAGMVKTCERFFFQCINCVCYYLVYIIQVSHETQINHATKVSVCVILQLQFELKLNGTAVLCENIDKSSVQESQVISVFENETFLFQPPPPPLIRICFKLHNNTTQSTHNQQSTHINMK